MGIVRESEAEWKGDLQSGTGMIRFGSKAYEGPYSFKERTADNCTQTNPEELIAAAHAGCFSMQLSALLTKAGHPPENILTTAKVHFGPQGEGFAITQIDLETAVTAPGLQKDEFIKLADKAKETCPVSKALSAVKIQFNATLK
jgi:osmotically inducible protein OsmC